jgi:YesN/AraC family two-component response regulator
MHRPQVLLVEDDRAVRDIVALFLSDSYDVKQAATGAEAISILQRDPVAAVVLDYRLPDRNGLELLGEIRTARPRMPVVMMTGYGSEWLCASALKLGITDYFPKPINVGDLLHSMRRIVSTEPPPPAEGGAEATRDEDGLASAREPAAGGPDLSIQKAIKLIQLRYWDDVSLSGLARELGMSKYHLSRRFKEVTGVTFRGYLLRTRLERAKLLLSSRRASITEVAHAVGFGDLPRFDKLFKRYAGLTPSAYRAQASDQAPR